MSPRRSLLVVDDDEDIRWSVAQALSEEGYEVAEACHGGAALELLHSGWRPDAILLDMMMPVMDGPTFRREQLKHAELASIPVVVFTANGSAREASERLEATGALAKPVALDELLAMIAEVLSR